MSVTRSLPRSKAPLGTLSCPACHPPAPGAAQARSFSGRAHTTAHPSAAAQSRSATPSIHTSSTRLFAGPSSPRARWSSTEAGGPVAVGKAETAEEREARIDAAELTELESMMDHIQFQEHDPSEPTPADLAYDAAYEVEQLAETARHPHTDGQPLEPPASSPIVDNTPPPPPPLNPFALLRPSFPAGPPTVADLTALRPKLFAKPDASSPEYLRILYRKSWEGGLNKLNTAFKKAQLLEYVSQPTAKGGLELKHDDPRLRAGTKAKKAKWWKPRKFADMSKKELSQAIMVLEWGMVDPEVLPKPRVGKQLVETLPLDDRTVFLLLSPNATTLPNLSRSYGVKASFARDPATGGLLLSLKGTKESVQQAREEVASLADVSAQQEFELPAPATTLRPELFQAVSRLSKTFLEPGSEPDMLAATAIDKPSIDRAERLLNTAFTIDAIQSSVRTFATIPTSLESLEYSLFPFTPSVPAPWTAGATSSFARVQGVSLAPLPSDGEEHAEHAAKLDFAKWAANTHMDTASRVPLSNSGPRNILPALLAPFGNEAKLEMKATFGHVVWPVYPPTQSQPVVAGGRAPLGLGPVLDGRWTFPKFAQWRNEIGPATKSVFLPSPPAGFLHSAGVVGERSESAPFANIVSDAELAAADQDALPRLDSDEFRQLVYRPLSLPKEGEPNERVEVEYAAEGVKATWLRESKVQVMVPNGAQDFAVTAAESKQLAPESVGQLPANLIAAAPTSISLDGRPYLLSTDRSVRRTFLLGPAANPRAFEHPRIQDRWDDNLEPGRGAEVSLVLGEGSGSNFWQRVWRAGLHEVDRMVAKPSTDSRTDKVRIFRGR